LITQITFGAQPSSIQYAYGFHYIYRSTNQAQSWNLIRSLSIGSRIGVVTDPQNEKVAYTFFDSTLMVSEDAGSHWKSAGKKSQRIFCLAIDPQEPSILYGGGPEGIWKSIDRGANWIRPNEPPYSIIALAIDPLVPRTIYATASYHLKNIKVWKTTNSGKTWKALSLSGVPVSSGSFLSILHVDPKDHKSIWAGDSVEGTLIHSADAGLTWKRVMHDKSIQSLVFDPKNVGTLFVSTRSLYLPQIFKTTDNGQT
jgi:photosystem II stability/assembly factor-like uncharacterized protein